MRALVIPVLIVLAVGCGPAPQDAPPPPPPTTVATPPPAPDGGTVAFENEYVKVIRFDLQPGQAQAVHDGADRLVYALNDYTIEWKEGEAEPLEKSRKAGEAHWHAAGPHAAKNLGAEPARFLVLARTAMALPVAEPPASGATDPGPVVFENEKVKVVEVTIEPGKATPKHWGGPRLIYSLSDYKIRFAEGEAEPVELSLSAGDAHWHAAGEHLVENAGEGPAHFLVVSFLS